MRFPAILKGVTALAVAVACTATAGASRAPAPPPAPPQPTIGAIPASAFAVEAVTPDSVARDATRLARAAAAHRAGDRRGVVEQLEPIDYTKGPTFADADRAAFLLGQAYLALGSHERFAQLAGDVAKWPATDYTGWLAFQLAVMNQGAVVPTGGEGSALALYLRALEQEASGNEAGADATWAQLATADTVTALGRDLAGAAIVKHATAMIARNEDPRALLGIVPAGSRYASRARHMSGLISLEHRDMDLGRETLEALLADDPTYAARREVELVLAGVALDQRRYERAHQAYARADRDWNAHRDSLEKLKAQPDDPALWTRWAIEIPSAALMLDRGPVEQGARRTADSATDLTTRGAGVPPALAAPANGAAFPWAVSPPSPAEWDSLGSSARRLGESSGELERTRWDHARERERLEAMADYLELGLARGRDEQAELTRHAAFLASIRATLDSLDRSIRSVRDESLRRILERAANVVQHATNDLLWVRGMRHFHLDGANRERAVPPPPGYSPPDSVVDREEELAQAISEAARSLAADAPGLIDRSYRQAWRPGLIDRTARQDSTVAAALLWVRRLVKTVDSSLAATQSSPELQRLAAQMKRLEKQNDSLGRADIALRRKVALAAIARTLDNMKVEREGIDYGLAVSSYGRSVLLGSAKPDSVDDPATTEWRLRSIGYFKNFLARNPQSAQRGEMRFRLADLLLVEARHDFNERMARYLAGGAGNQGPLPLLSHGDALDLYRAILREDPSFEHLDAVRFNAAMILADQGDPEAEHFFQELVTLHPQSAYCPEAYLRMGDMRFDEKRFPQAIELYAKAAAGPNPEITAIALYKTGWAHYNDDHFAQAAEAFAAVLELYLSEKRAEISVDLEGEAEAYLVHSLAGAGGAPAFERHFAKTGSRPYEERILLALGQNFRRLNLYADAALVDQMFIRRFPLRPDALLAAERLVDTHRRSNNAVDLDGARLELAPLFAPGSRWQSVQRSDSLRTAGAAFSLKLWKASAAHHHHRARSNDSRDDWRTALDLYEKMLQSWPNDAEAPVIDLRAGEAAVALDLRSVALRHYDHAATSPVDSIATQALWAKVAATDTWYRATRPAGDPLAIGKDAEAKAVIAAADELLKRYPQHPGAADLTWRQANLAFAHRWNDRAAQDFTRMMTNYPRDKRVPQAAGLKADALFRIPDYESAGAAYEAALAMAQANGRDSLARRAAQAIPICYYRYADSMRVARPNDHEGNAARFEKVATGWPAYEHAHIAQYRAGLAYLAAKKTKPGVGAMEKLIREFPKSEYVKDAHLQIAKAWDEAGEKVSAGDAYARFAERFKDDENAKDAWLKAADLYAAAGLDQRAEAQKLSYIKAYPDDQETAMEILEPLARRDLAGLGAERSIATLLPKPAPVAKAVKGAKGAAATAKGVVTKGAAAATNGAAAIAGPPSHLADYLARAEKNPTLASRGLLAEVKFREAEEAYAAYDKVRLTQPLAKSIKDRQKKLDEALTLYRKVVDAGVPEWAHASAYRMGQALIAFGRALENSQRPADLSGDDLTAYEDVLIEKSQPFYQRGEEVWTELLRQKGKDVKDDTWIAQTQNDLWKRLGARFYFRPETDFPLVAAKEPQKTSVGAGTSGTKAQDTTQARREEDER